MRRIRVPNIFAGVFAVLPNIFAGVFAVLPSMFPDILLYFLLCFLFPSAFPISLPSVK